MEVDSNVTATSAAELLRIFVPPAQLLGIHTVYATYCRLPVNGA